MTSKQPDGLSAAEKGLLGTYRASLAPAPARKAKAWAALGSLAKTGAGTAAAGTTKLILLSALTTATALGGVGVWVGSEDTSAETSATRGIQTEREQVAPPTTAGPRAEAQEQAVAPLQAEAVRPVIQAPRAERVQKNPTSRSRSAAKPQASAATTPRRLEAAARSLEKMRSALSTGHNARVLSLVSAHRTEFEHAVFAEEVDGLEVMASCRRSPDASALRRLTAFGSKYPASPQTPALRRACRPDPTPVQRPSKAEPSNQEK